MLGRLAEAHTRLCEGQGAELAWRDARQNDSAPLDALKIYALKTAPAFEAALYAGLRLAGPADALREPAARFARHLGVAFQILNDLDDWSDQQPNKRGAGRDVLGGRPTVLWALALENAGESDRSALEDLATSAHPATEILDRVRTVYQRAGVFVQARALVAKHRQRAHEIAERVQPQALAQLLNYLADTILPG